MATKIDECRSEASPLPTHTPTPWHVSGHGRHLHIGAPTSVVVLASMNEHQTDVVANAAFIMKAVNNHDDLVKALKDAAVALPVLVSMCKAAGLSAGQEAARDILGTVSAALAKAEAA